MADKFAALEDRVESPARKMWAVVPHATNELDPLPKALRANTGGTITLQAAESAVDVTITVVAGEMIPVRARYVRAVGTTASIHALA